MDPRRPVFWHQGLFLQPQHFQLTGLYHKSLLEPLLKFGLPHFWGVGGIEIAEAALGNRLLEVLRGEFVFQDGTYVCLPGNCLLEPRPFEEDWVNPEEPFTVYLGLRKWNEEGENVTVTTSLQNISQVATRFVTTADPEEVKDLYHDGPPAQVKALYYVLKIFWETERDLTGDYLALPIAQLQRDADTIKLSERFVPPCLTISASQVLQKIVKEIRDQVASRARQLEEYKVQRGVHTAEFGSRDMVFLLALRSLNRYVPMLTHMVESQSAHPWVVYGLLRQFIGELSTFSTSVNFAGELEDGTRLLRSYEHFALGDCFSGAQSLVSSLLEEITAGPEYIIQLIYDGTYFAADLSPSVFEGSNRYYLVLETDEDPETVKESIATVAKLGARESLPILIARALPGVRMEHLDLPPQELPRRARSIYFQVDHHSDQWAYVERGNNIALYWDAAPEDLKVELMVVGRS